jgi:pre-mRNA cleavage complex 2 protein Pcf11
MNNLPISKVIAQSVSKKFVLPSLLLFVHRNVKIIKKFKAPFRIIFLVQEPNPDAIDRLLNVSEQTKRNFLDRKFLKRQKISSGQRSLRLWYVDLDTWMAGNVRHEPPSAGDGYASGSHDRGGEIPPPDGPGVITASVTADEDQTHCALSGEKFEQYWDENYQEWRYKGAKRLAGEEAARYGLKDGALVLLSALGGLSSAFVKHSNEMVNEVGEGKDTDTKEVPEPSGDQLSIQVKEEEERPPKRVKADDV